MRSLLLLIDAYSLSTATDNDQCRRSYLHCLAALPLPLPPPLLLLRMAIIASTLPRCVRRLCLLAKRPAWKVPLFLFAGFPVTIFYCAAAVNQRLLIDKMLARYSSDFVVCRELIQNGTSPAFSFSPPPAVRSVNLSSVCTADDAQAKNFVLEFVVEPDSAAASKSNTTPSIVEIRTRNDGRLFTTDDWNRVATIAYGSSLSHCLPLLVVA